jgi:hypothetical protein
MSEGDRSAPTEVAIARRVHPCGDQMEGSLDTARRFAWALDAEDYDRVATCLSSTGEYSICYRIVRGGPAIVESYREAGTWAVSMLESVRYENEVRSAPTGAVITFLDHLAHHGHTLAHRCEQHLNLRKPAESAEFCTSMCLESAKRWRPSSKLWVSRGRDA